MAIYNISGIIYTTKQIIDVVHDLYTWFKVQKFSVSKSEGDYEFSCIIDTEKSENEIKSCLPDSNIKILNKLRG